MAEVDVVIFCTGYKLGGREDGRPAITVFGRDGLPLSQRRRELRQLKLDDYIVRPTGLGLRQPS